MTLYMIVQQDISGCHYHDPEFFDAASDAERAVRDGEYGSPDLPKGHAIVMYEVREVRTLKEST